MRLLGLEIRGIGTMGGREVNDMYFTDCRVSADRVVGRVVRVLLAVSLAATGAAMGQAGQQASPTPAAQTTPAAPTAQEKAGSAR